MHRSVASIRSFAPLAVLALAFTVLVGAGATPATAAAEGPTSEAEAILALTNQQRAVAGAPPLTLCANLTDSAIGHARDQAARGSMGHVGSDGSTVSQRAERAGYAGWTGIAENVAYGYSTPASVVSAWVASSGHRANIMFPGYTHLGVGLARSSSGVAYWTQDFGTAGTCGAFYDPNAFGSFELAASPAKGNLRVAGWAVDRDAGTAPIEVHVYVSGAGHNLGPADGPRSDVGGALGLGSGHGFDATFAVPAGNHQVCAHAINVGPGANADLGCRTVWVPDPNSPFLDVLSSSTFFADIAWLTDRGLATGYADHTFKPSLPVSRQALASFLWKAGEAPTGPFPAVAFPDVGPTHPFLTPIAWMVSRQLATGYADGLYRPTTPVSRQATAAFLWRLAGKPAVPPTTPSFPDVAADNPFGTAIRWAASQGITTGYPDGTFRPAAPVSRQAMATFLHRWLA